MGREIQGGLWKKIVDMMKNPVEKSEGFYYFNDLVKIAVDCGATPDFRAWERCLGKAWDVTELDRRMSIRQISLPYKDGVFHGNYGIVYDFLSFHEEGKGGYTEHLTVLNKDREILLASRRHGIYLTAGGDSENWPSGNEELVTCLLKEDEFARKMFEVMRVK